MNASIVPLQRDRQVVGRSSSIDLDQLLHKHAAQTSSLAERLIHAEGVLLDIIEQNASDHPRVAMELMAQMDRVRASLLRDLRSTMLALVEARRKPSPIKIAVLQQQGDGHVRREVAGQLRRQLQRG